MSTHAPNGPDLAHATQPSPVTPGEYTLDVPDGWQQGRGAFGGLVFCALVRAIEAHVGAASPGPGRALRSLSAELPGASEVGGASVRVETLRAGTGVTTAAARLVQNGELRAHAVALLGRARGEDAPAVELEPPRMPPYADAPVFDSGGFAPTFTQHFEFRNTGPMPFAGGRESRVEGWVRARVPPPHGVMSPAAFAAAMIDVWWPAIFSTMPAPRPIGTVAYLLQIVGDLGDLDPAAPMFHRARALATAQGYSVEQRELWDAGGRLVALNTQTIAIIK